MSYCVYKHSCPNGKVYIGITGRNPIKRWNAGLGYKNHVFYRAILKYGWNNIKHEILFDNLTCDQAKQKEIELIAEYKSNQREYGYNFTNGGDGIFGYKHSEETKRKISRDQHGELNGFHGRHHSEEVKKRIAEAHKGNSYTLGYHHTDETKKKIGEAAKRLMSTDKMKEIARKNVKKAQRATHKKTINLDTGEIFESTSAAARAIGRNSSSGICACAKGLREKCGGYHWAYYEEVT